MPRGASAVPEESFMLCEGCGYIISGLPPDAACCPECAKPLVDSAPERRSPPAWEREDGRSATSRFLRTTLAVLARPARFFRSLPTRINADRSRRFARLHWAIVSFLLGLTADLQLQWVLDLPGWPQIMARAAGMRTSRLLIGTGNMLLTTLLGTLLGFVLCWLWLAGLTRLTSRLTAWEAAWRGLRLPLPVVHRAMHYHAACYLPVALLAFLTVAGYQLGITIGWLTELSAPRYLYLLAGEVLVAAFYLFKTYWAGMRNIMFANR